MGLAMVATPGSTFAAPRTRLVHCGDATCLRISGRRPHAAVAVRVAGHTLRVEGKRAWRATVSLATARGWAGTRDGTLPVTLIDVRTGSESTELAMLPPGALGRRI